MSESEATIPQSADPGDAESAGQQGPTGAAAVFVPTINAIVAPGKAFDALAARPVLSAWILVWVTLAMTGLALMNLDVQRQFTRVGIVNAMQQRGQEIDTEQLAQTIETMDRFAPLMAVLQNAVLVILVLVVAAMLWGGSTVMGGRARFSRALSVASVGAVIHPLLITLYVALNWRISPPEVRRMEDIADAVPTLGLDLLAGSDMSFAVRTFLMRIDLFNIWWIMLTVIGAERLLGLKRGAAVTLAVGIWLVSAIVSAALASLGS